MFARIRTANSPARTYLFAAIRWPRRPRLPSLGRCRKSQLEKAIADIVGSALRRVRPHLDDKILTSWNGLMISAFAKGAQVLDEPRYLEAAQRAADFILIAYVRCERRDAAASLSRWRGCNLRISGRLCVLHRRVARFIRNRFQSAAIWKSRSAGGQNARAFRRLGRGRILQHRRGRQQSGAAHERRLRWRRAIGKLLRACWISCGWRNFTDRAEYREAAERTLQALGSKIATQSVGGPANACRARLLLRLSPRNRHRRRRRADARAFLRHAAGALPASAHHCLRFGGCAG